MSNWLYTEVLKQDDLRVPTFARQSTLNWMRALRFEIEREHGASNNEQFKSCLRHFKNAYSKPLHPLDKGCIFESLYSSLTYSLALQSLEEKTSIESWVLPSGIVSWYYSVYFSVLSMFGSIGQVVNDNHSSVYRAFGSNLCEKMPHPFNMKASHIKNEKYKSFFPNYPESRSYSLSKAFPETEESSKGMILEYLSGNAGYYTWLTKKIILEKAEYKNFLTKVAKEERDRKLQKNIGFMHCAYRYRGKANYRDGIYLTYGKASPAETKAFVNDMRVVSQFMFIMGLALSYRTSLKPDVAEFLNDIDINLKGIEALNENNCFWRVL